MMILTIAELTIREGQRRRILWMALIMGLLFLTVFGIGQHLIFVDLEEASIRSVDMQIPATFLLMAGLYVTNFLIIIMSVLISVAAIAGEIDTHVVEAIVTKPVRRLDIVLGKWLGFAVMILLYSLLLAGGVILITRLRTGFSPESIAGGLALMALNGLVMMTLTIAGGTRLSTLANGVLAFMLYGLAFVGGWVETIGALLRNETAVNLGIVSSLLMPIEALWKKASLYFQPRLLGTPDLAGPFIVPSEPSDLMIAYALLYVLALLTFAVWSFSQRDL